MSRSLALSPTRVLHKITTSGAKIRPVLKKNPRYLFHEVKNAAS